MHVDKVLNYYTNIFRFKFLQQLSSCTDSKSQDEICFISSLNFKSHYIKVTCLPKLAVDFIRAIGDKFIAGASHYMDLKQPYFNDV